jgi:hypothetical protein
LVGKVVIVGWREQEVRQWSNHMRLGSLGKGLLL